MTGLEQLLHPFITSNKNKGIYSWKLTTKITTVRTLYSNVKGITILTGTVDV
jgi:hypothetical protein